MCWHMQAAKTYLERNFEEFAGADVDALLQHSLKVGTNPSQSLSSCVGKVKYHVSCADSAL